MIAFWRCERRVTERMLSVRKPAIARETRRRWVIAPSSVVEGNVVVRQERVYFCTVFKTEQMANGVFGKLAVAIAFDDECFECKPSGVLAGGGELGSESVRNFQGHLHRITIAFPGF